MGGSGHSGWGGGGITVETERCGEYFYFHAVVTLGEEQVVWNNCNEGDLVHIKINTQGKLPKLEVIKTVDSFSIGLVPAASTGIITCISAGWTYTGVIQKKSGNQFSPEIYVRLKGEK